LPEHVDIGIPLYIEIARTVLRWFALDETALLEQHAQPRW
jgi:hypothetical protein